MTKEQKGATIKFLLWFVTLSIICFIGMNNIFALSNQNQVQFYDNNGSSVSWKSTSWNSTTKESTATFGLTANSTGGLLVYTLSNPVVNNHIYSMFVSVGTRNYGGATRLSSKNCIGLGSTLSQATNDYISCTLTPTYSNASNLTSEYDKGIWFIFKANKNASYIAVPFTSNETVYDVPIYSYGIEMEDNGDSTNMTEQQVASIVDTQTDTIEDNINNLRNDVNTSILNSQSAIINNQNSNNQALIQNDNTNTQNIINNNNTNTDKIIADNKKNFNDCHDSVNILPSLNTTRTINGITFTKNNDGSIIINGTATANAVYPINVNSTSNSQNISIKNNTQYTLSSKGIVSGIMVQAYYQSTYYTAPQTFTSSSNVLGAYVLVLQGRTINNVTIYPQLQEGSTATDFEEYGKEICVNKLDEQTKTSKGILGKLGDLFTSFGNFVTNLFDTSGPDTDSISGMAGWLPPGPVDSVINLPLTFFNTLNNSLGGTCQTFSVNLPFVNTTLNLPCFSSYMSQYVSNFSTLWTFIGTIASVVILYRYLLALYVWVDNVLMLRYEMHEDFGGNSANFGGV